MADEEVRRDPSAERAAQPPRRRLSWGWLGCAGAVILVALLLTPVITFVVRWIRNPERRATMEHVDQVVTLPQEWIKSATLPPDEVVSFQNRFYNEVQALEEQYGSRLVGTNSTTQTAFWKLQRGEEISPDEQNLLNEFMVAVNPLIEETSAAVALEGYTSEMSLYTTAPAAMAILRFSRFASLAAIETARRGDCEKALELAAVPLRYSRHETPSSLLTEIMDFMAVGNAADTYYALADLCGSPAQLRRGLELMNLHRDVALTTGSELWVEGDWAIGLIRANAFGYPVDLSPQSRGSFWFQFANLLGQSYHQWVLENIPPDDIRFEISSEWMRTEGKSDYDPNGILYVRILNDNVVTGNLIRWVTGGSLYANMVSDSLPDLQEAQRRAHTALARYDLTRMEIAGRLDAVENADQPTSATAGAAARAASLAVIGKYLHDIPSDPYSGEDFRFNTGMQKFYSIGPDEDDDDAQVPYDVTNGTVSDGDIWMERR